MTALPLGLLPDSAQVDGSGRLAIGGCDVLELAAEYGTPLFVYDEEHIRIRCRRAVEAFGDTAVYAAKAFLCRAMARLAHEEGMRLDVSTLGELAVAVAAGVPGDRLVVHGNNKSETELRAALEAGAGMIVVDSFDELARLEGLVDGGDLEPPAVMLRITPGVEAHTHEFTRTGNDDSKFGFTVSTGAAAEAVRLTESSPFLDLVGIHAHIGSQVFRAESFTEAVEIVARFTAPLGVDELSIGGGLGVPYVEGESAPSISEWAETIHVGARRAGFGGRLWAEPGRAIVASAAITLYRVGTIKDLPGIRTYVAVDGGMSDNPRPVLYGSGYEAFLPRATTADRRRAVRVVGKHCESGDILVRQAAVPADLVVGDILATPVTGAYGHSMGSNYNKVLRPPVVFVADGAARLVIRRETVADLLATDLG
ncbi:MAG: diaminopimelate decarboxylase [Acidimicrobiia bacterium]